MSNPKRKKKRPAAPPGSKAIAPAAPPAAPPAPRIKQEPRLSIGTCATLACVLEASAPKAGNVHPGVSFDDVSFSDFVLSASAIGPILEDTQKNGVGPTILECVKATHAAVGSNTNLGIILLLAPLCAVPWNKPIRGVEKVLKSMTQKDARAVYEAIRMARPGGMGKVAKGDVNAEKYPTMPLLDAMELAAERDMIALQYVTGFHDVLGYALQSVLESAAVEKSLSDAIVLAHLLMMAAVPDTLILRKCGDRIAIESALRAQAVLDADWPMNPRSRRMFTEFDRWLRADGNRRNPGTSADFIAAALYIAIRNGHIKP